MYNATVTKGIVISQPGEASAVGVHEDGKRVTHSDGVG